jgi:hypothetical protein
MSEKKYAVSNTQISGLPFKLSAHWAVTGDGDPKTALGAKENRGSLNKTVEPLVSRQPGHAQDQEFVPNT